MLRRLKIPLLLAIAVASLAIHAAGLPPPRSHRDYLVHVWTTENGLPQNWVSSIEQTPDGYLWVGTRYGGLARFDGMRFELFNPQNTPELKDVQVEHLSLDESGRLWIVMGNESISSLRQGHFELLREPRATPRLRLDRVLSSGSNGVVFSAEGSYLATHDPARGSNGWKMISTRPPTVPAVGTFCHDAEGTIWFLNGRGRIARFRTNQFEVLPQELGLPEMQAVSLAVDSEKRVWAASARHLGMWNGASFVDRTPPLGEPLRGVQRIAFSGDGGLWVLESKRLRKYMGGHWLTETDPEEFHPDLSGGAYSLHGDAQGNAWLVTYGHGLWHIRSNGSSHQLTEKEGLPSVFITRWFEDNEGNVWVGTAGGGMARIRESIFRVLGPTEGLPGKVARSVCVDADGRLWAGTMSGGLAYLQNNAFTSVPLPTVNPGPVESITVHPRRGSGVWIGSLNFGLMQFESGQVTRPAGYERVGPAVRVIFEDSHKDLWVGGLVNLFRFSEEGQFKSFGAADGFVNGIAIGALAEDADGSLWVGTGPGTLWKVKEGVFTEFTPPAQWPSARFSAILPDTNGVVWIGTLGSGLLRFHKGLFTRYTKKDGLPDNNITQLLDGRDGNVWAGTYAGIFHVAKSDLESMAIGQTTGVPCRVYRQFDGLPALECSGGFNPACWRANDGRLWFSTANGLVSVNPREARFDAGPPKVRIEELLVDGKPRTLPASTGGKELAIEPGRHYVQFRFTALNFTAPDSVRFRVQLEGGDPQWQDTGGQRIFGYGPLMPGSYKFRVMACNSDGAWNGEGTALAFTVKPYYWETWWFEAVLGLTAFSVLGVTVALTQRRRYKSRLERLQREQAVERERARIAQDLHDDLGTSLTQISMLSALANRENTPAAESKEIIQQVRGRAKEMVTALDEIVWAVNPKNDSLMELINYLGYFAEEFFRSTSIRCRLEIPERLPSPPLSSEVRHHLFLAFKEAINNVARHSGASEVLLRVANTETEALISVEDNGHGFQQGENHEGREGNGLRNMMARMEQIGGHTRIRSIPGSGTIVELHLPFPRV